MFTRSLYLVSGETGVLFCFVSGGEQVSATTLPLGLQESTTPTAGSDPDQIAHLI